MTTTPQDHCVRVLYEARYPHATGKHDVEVLARGDGSPEHWLEVFRAALIAAGFSLTMANRLSFDDE